MEKITNSILSLTKMGKMQIRINTLENENETLKSTIKEELYKSFMAKLGESVENDRLRLELKNARKKIKILKEMLKEERNTKEKKKRR